MSKFIDLTGHVFGQLTVLGLSDRKTKSHSRLWSCVCQCGNKSDVHSSNLKRGITISCGCFKVEVTKNRFTKHGNKANRKVTQAYTSWQQMHERCRNTNRSDYKYYGAKGITVCKEWGDFQAFIVDMGEPQKGMTLDRINSNGNYEKSNCRWATRLTQSRNNSNAKYISWNNQTHCLTEWAEILNFRYDTIKSRLLRGWTVEKAFTTPLVRNLYGNK